MAAKSADGSCENLTATNTLNGKLILYELFFHESNLLEINF